MPLLKCSASKARPKNGIEYITDPKKAAIVSVRNLFEDEDYAKQFEETAKRFGKGKKYDERKYYHFKLSCARKDNVTIEKAHAYAEEIAEAFFKNYECVIATHTDTASRVARRKYEEKNKKLRKEKNANFQTMIPRELFEEINVFLTEKDMTKVDFIKKAFEVMQNNR